MRSLKLDQTLHNALKGTVAAMAKKRKAGKATGNHLAPRNDSTIDPEDHFHDSEDEFFAGRDKILLDEEPAAKRRRRLQEQENDLQPSDEEVFQDPLSDEESLDGLDSDPQYEDDAPPDEEEGEVDDGYWGASKGDYYNTDVIETEADALEEEAEAKRLQQKQLRSMTDADFGFDESAWVDDTRQTGSGRRPAVERLPEFRIPDNATDQERMQMLKSRYPEFEPLTNDFLELQNSHVTLKEEVEMVGTAEPTVVLIKFLALSAYMGSIAMYLAVMTSSRSGMALNPAELHDHPVMATILRCRQLWLDSKDLKVVPHQQSESESESESDQDPFVVGKQPLPPSKPLFSVPPSKKPTAKRASPSPSPSPLDYAVTGIKAKKPRRTKRNDLQTLLAASLQKPAEEESDFGDEAPLTQAEVEEKARKKKSLRFYTSQIAQKANKRGAASRHAGGDDDIPHKERLRDRQDRLMREAEQRGNSGAHGLETLGTDDEDLDGVRQNHEESNEYYNSLVTNSKQKKLDKKTRAEAYAEAAKSGAQVFEEEQVGPDGKRKITYAIEKNKGLAPKRKKDVRNPRVKKRKKYDEKMKKLSSIRQVYKGGEGRGGYGGEATGIKTNLVKSTKL
jgi:U3 small nucleolar RNA-associated protein 3